MVCNLWAVDISSNEGPSLQLACAGHSFWPKCPQPTLSEVLSRSFPTLGNPLQQRFIRPQNVPVDGVPQAINKVDGHGGRRPVRQNGRVGGGIAGGIGQRSRAQRGFQRNEAKCISVYMVSPSV